MRDWIDSLIEDPLERAKLCGTVMGENPIYLNQFLYAFGESLFSNLQICDRIDFLFDREDLQPQQRESIFHSKIRCGKINDTIWVQDISGDHDLVRIMIFNDLEPGHDGYGIRIFLGSNETPGRYLRQHWDMENDEFPSLTNIAGQVCRGDCTTYYHTIVKSYVFWNFNNNGNDGRVFLDRHSEGFQDIQETKSLALLIKWASNMLGFQDKSLDEVAQM